jgi:hypothetical protein
MTGIFASPLEEGSSLVAEEGAGVNNPPVRLNFLRTFALNVLPAAVEA